MKKGLNKIGMMLALATLIVATSGCAPKAEAVDGAMAIPLTDLPQEMVDPAQWSDDPQDIYLLAQLVEDDIYLYGMNDNAHVLLRQGEQRALLEWQYLTPRLILPEMKFADFDGDGGKELAVILYTGSGTGISIEELHIVTWQGNTATDHCYQAQDYQKEMLEQVKWLYDAENSKATLHCGYLDVYLTEQAGSHYDEVEGLAAFGDQVDFEVTENDKIKVKFAVGLSRTGWDMPDYIGEITAQVVYRNGKFAIDPNTMIYKENV